MGKQRCKQKQGFDLFLEERNAMRKVDKLFSVMERRETEEKERLEANKAKLDALIGSLKVSEKMMYWLHVCRGLVSCHGHVFWRRLNVNMHMELSSWIAFCR